MGTPEGRGFVQDMIDSHNRTIDNILDGPDYDD